MDKDYLVLKRASASRPSGVWNDDDFDVLADGVAVGRIMKAAAAPVGAPWLWTILCYEDRQPTHGYEPTREAAIAARPFAPSLRILGLHQPQVFVLGCQHHHFRQALKLLERHIHGRTVKHVDQDRRQQGLSL